MKKLINITLTALCIFALVFTLSSCGKNNDISDNGTDGSSAAVTTEADTTPSVTEDTPNPASDFEYEVNEENNLITITKYIGTDLNVIIPETINSLTVSAIGEKAFENSTIETVILPQSCNEIKSRAFMQCKSLVSIEFNGPINEIGDMAFMWCKSLKSIDFSLGLIHISFGALSECTSLESIIFSENIVHISEQAFGVCTSLKNIALPNSLVTVRQNAFIGCTGLETLDLYCNNVYWEYNIFVNVPNLKKIIVHEGVTVLFDCFKDDQIETIILPKSIEQVGALYMPNLKEIYFSDGFPRSHKLSLELRPDFAKFRIESDNIVSIYYDPSTADWDLCPEDPAYKLVPIK